MKLQEKLIQLREEQKAILAANFYNLETLQAVVGAAKDENQPVILQLSESSIHYIGINIAVAMARQALETYGVEGWIHLDHGSSLEIVQQCLEAGFDSVMIDASEHHIEENIVITRQAVQMAEKHGANVEAELGYIAKLNQSQDNSGFTQPEDAVYFTQKTGVDALAVSIGSAHGFYKSAPKLDIELLSRIRAAVNIPLVLHGGSGIPEEVLKEAIRKGITKINVATETKNAFMKQLKQELTHTDEIDLRIVFPKATESARELIRSKLQIIQ